LLGNDYLSVGMFVLDVESNSNGFTGSIKKLDSELTVPDRLYYNEIIKLDESGDRWGFVGRNATHVIDVNKLECFSSHVESKYAHLL
jgi:hypothetical protein